MLRPADGIDDGANFFRISILANRGKHLPGLDALVGGNTGDARHHLRRIAGVVLLHQLEDTARMLQRKIVCRIWRQRGSSNRTGSSLGSARATSGVSLSGCGGG